MFRTLKKIQSAFYFQFAFYYYRLKSRFSRSLDFTNKDSKKEENWLVTYLFLLTTVISCSFWSSFFLGSPSTPAFIYRSALCFPFICCIH